MKEKINHPKHYTTSKFECIDIIEKLELGFHLGNVMKYIFRHKEKNGIEDIKKARWYLDRYIKLEEK